jgi:hypothetical protein
MTTPESFDELLRNPALFRAVLDFNGLAAPPPLELSKPGRQDRQFGPESSLLALLAANPRVRCAFVRPAPKTAVWCFAPPPNRLALLPPPLLKRLIFYWSAAVWAEDLARIIEKTRLSQIMANIGPELYRYAVRRGRFQLGSLRDRFRRGAQNENPECLTQAFFQPGEQLLSLCLDRWPEELCIAWEIHWRRAGYQKLQSPQNPKKLKNLSWQGEWQNDVPFSTLWSCVEKILLSEVAPEWQPCFSS